MNNYSDIYPTIQYPNIQHKPRISIVNDDMGKCYQCTDGGLTQYGRTPQEAFDNLKACR